MSGRGPGATRGRVLTDRQRALLEQRARDAGISDVRPPGSGRIGRRTETGPVPLSFAQQRLWFMNRLAPDSSFYNVPMVTPIQGRLDVNALEWSLDEIVRRHEALRTTFPMQGTEPVQLVGVDAQLPLERVDLTGTPAPLLRARAGEEAERQARAPFDLALGPVVRAKLIRLSTVEHWLVVTLHHIVTDGWSMGVFADELHRLYTARVGGRPSPLAELPIQYPDYALWQREWLQGEVLERQLDYWRTQLDGLSPVRLITDRPRGPATFEGDFCRLELAPPLVSALRSLASEQNATLFMTLLAAFEVLLCRLTGQDDVVVGSPIANRTRPELEGLIGFFVNTLVLRADLSGDPTFRDALGRVRRLALDAFAHQDLPFEKLVEELHPDRDLDRNPLFQIGFVLQTAWSTPARTSTQTAAGDDSAPPDIQRGTSIFDLAMHLWERGGKVEGGIEYSTGLFDRSTIERLAQHFTRLVEGVAIDPDTPISALPLLTDHERHRVVVAWNRTATTESPLAPLPDLVAGHAERTPTAVAVRFGNRSVTYFELNRLADQHARVLRSRGVGRRALVALCFPRSIDWVVGALAVLKCGAAFVPLDPAYPPERLRFMIEDSRAAIVVTRRSAVDAALLADMPVLWLDEIDEELTGIGCGDLDVTVAPDDVAYVIYTSGSTGVPKGVLLEHRGLSNVIAGQRDVLGVGPHDRVLQFSPLSFDASVFELGMALGLGGTLCIAPADSLYPGPGLLDLLERERVTVVTLPPSALGALPVVALPDLATLIVAGEPCPAAHVQRWAPGRRFFNLYGPTEATIWSTWAECAPAASRPPIGRPIPNTRVYLLDANGQPVPIGVAGEIHIGGAGVARGYLGRPELTAERFVERDIDGVGSERLYRSGDLGRYLPDGQIDFLGRADSQVKVRGHRIELEEIESVLTDHPSIEEAVVIVREDEPGERRLVAYLTTPDMAAADDSSAAEASAEHVSYWHTLYEDVYAANVATQDPRFNVAGWDSSYTGEPLPADDMREWLDATLARLESLRSRRILEIGCGSGLLLLRMVPTAECYVASDFSGTALAAVQREVAGAGWEDRVTLAERAADDFSWLPDRNHDLVVLNSVIQYFPSAAYLRDVLVGAVATVAGDGAVFVGDVRSLALLDTFSLSVELARMDAETTVAQVAERAERRGRLERELVVDPEFFYALAREQPRITGVEILAKRGSHLNELTKFRYDVILHIGSAPPDLMGVTRWHWDESLDVDAIGERLCADEPDVVHLVGVANGRVEHDLRARALLPTKDPSAPATTMRDEAAGETRAVDPEALARSAEDAGYRVELHESSTSGAGAFDAVLARIDPARPAGGRLPAPAIRATARRVKPWSHYTNSPSLGVFLRTIVPQIRQYLSSRVPDHLIPTHFVPLAQIPRTPGGKVDRSKLPPPERARPDLGVEYVAPTLATEKALASIWAEALRVQDVGIHDNYFELGGDSILGMQIVARARTAGVELAPRDLFEHQTIADLVRYCVSRDEAVATRAGRGNGQAATEARPGAQGESTAPDRFTLSKLSDDELARLAGRLRSKRNADDER